MASERELLDRLIKQKLGGGKTEFEVNVGLKGKSIDLVFEKEEEIWIIEAKRVLDYGALGQVLTYEELYKDHFSPSKAVRLGMVCEEGGSEPLLLILFWNSWKNLQNTKRFSKNFWIMAENLIDITLVQDIPISMLQALHIGITPRRLLQNA